MKAKVNLFIVGAAKSGTSSLFKMLGKHPDIFIGPKKEPHYFAKDLFQPHTKYKERLCLTFEDYESNYQNYQNEKYSLDASVYYMYFRGVAQRIFEYNPEAKVIMICRESVDRFYSHYKMLLKEGVTQLPLIEFIDNPIDNNGLDCLKMGLYQEAQREYKNIFKDNFLVLDYAEFKNGNQLIKKVINFLDLSESEIPIMHENISGIPKHQFLSYLHMNFPLTLYLKKIMPKNKLRHYLGRFILNTFYHQKSIDRTSRKLLEKYYAKNDR
jgi:hypothetical protein